MRRSATSYERDLARKLYKRGWVVMRAPASGAKVKRYPYPDLVALKRGYSIAVEVKTTSSERPIYIPKRQIEILKEWNVKGGAEPWIAVKVLDGRGWRFYSLDLLTETEKSYKLILEGGITLDELDSKAEGKAYVPLTHFLPKQSDGYTGTTAL
ncbi:Holliday junction resolvase [Ignicoccus pacificus DSM 13166]|uniref:Crossover junction endodeoxyribonuclease Hjc n=1 Tax=Ignicoccus pacificus DSM 13166 TaxID=940294 RepID=A0A977K9B3_9CREN|nr:Holliday junction resolvase [Ignicoccus pacificus DSM 13166]